MQLTFIGVPLFLIGIILLFTRSLSAMVAFVMITSIFGGSAAIILPALGGSSIPPLQFVLPFLLLRILMPGSGRYDRVGEALHANLALGVFVAYGLLSAYVAPRIFANDMMVPPLRFAGLTNLFDAIPLQPTSQNLTTSVYMLGTFLLAFAIYVSSKTKGAERTLVTTAVWISFIHAISGLVEIALRSTPAEIFFVVFRNGTYAQLEQSYGVFSRMSGFFPEASAYSAFAFTWFVFMFECWYGGVRSRACGLAALILAVVLIFSTSASAYASIAGYGVIMLLRMILIPQSVKFNRILHLAIVGIAAIVVAAIALAAIPSFANAFSDMILHMTVEKSGSDSGLQRLFWAKKGFEAFAVSNALGIGPGSFRSSSLATAILGSMGVIGAVTFVIYVLQVFMPLRASTYIPAPSERQAVGRAASWTVLIGLIPQAIAAPSADPGLLFALFAGAALSLRSRPDEPAPTPTVIRKKGGLTSRLRSPRHGSIADHMRHSTTDLRRRGSDMQTRRGTFGPKRH